MSAAEGDLPRYQSIDMFAMGCTLFFLCTGYGQVTNPRLAVHHTGVRHAIHHTGARLAIHHTGARHVIHHTLYPRVLS